MFREYSRARIEKDKNFDGKFYFAVKTTGIVCKPSCPSPVAKEHNVEYYESLYEAFENGYRPCLRCRPDIELEYTNGSIQGVSTINAALKKIHDGYLNYHSLSELADELVISSRHLRQLFVKNLGTSPVKIARYHKTLFARKLLLSSDQSITDVAFASGFGSVRQFNEVFKEMFHTTPSFMRKNMQPETSKPNRTTLLLNYKKPFAFLQMLDFLRIRAIKGVEQVTDNSYSRTFRTQNTQGYFTVQDNPKESSLELSIVCDDIKCFMEIHNRVRRMFDLDTDFTVINKRFSKDVILSKGMKNRHVPRLPAAFSPYEFIIRAILGQQITIKAATTLAARITKAANIQTDATSPEGLDYFFPIPTELIEMDLNGLGITKTRQQTIHTTTQAVIDNTINLTMNQTFDTFYKEFSALKGIGNWTINYVAMRGLGMLDSFPASDLGVIKALMKGDKKPTLAEIIKQGEKWRPYRTYATLCLWNSMKKDD
jgi:AraC family transcriptional regulator of adaptative response / DNA-3-methyladenine glycosylase II